MNYYVCSRPWAVFVGEVGWVAVSAHDALLGPPAEEELDEKSADIGIYD